MTSESFTAPKLMMMALTTNMAGEKIPWCFFSLPWHMFFGAGPIVCLVLHYCSLQEHIALGGLHTCRARRSSGRMRSTTWGVISACLGLLNFMNTICLDVIPFCFPAYTDPLELVSEETYAFIMGHWFELVISCFEDNQKLHLAFLSSGAYGNYADLRFGGKNNVPEFIRSKCISGDDNEPTFGVHPSRIYNGKFWNHNALKCATKGDLYLTRLKKELRGNKDDREVLYLRSIFDENSEAYKIYVTNRKKMWRSPSA